MSRVRWASGDDATAIGAFAAASPRDASFEHLYEYQCLRAGDAGLEDPWYAIAEDGRRIVGLAPLVRTGPRTADGVLEFARSAVVATDESVAEALVEAILDRARSEGIESLGLTLPDRALRRLLPPHVDVDHFTQRLELHASVAEHEAELPSRKRSYVRAARRDGLTVRRTALEHPEMLWQVQSEISARTPILRVSAPETYTAILDALAPRCRVRQVSLMRDEEILGTLVLLLFGGNAFMYRGGLRTDSMQHGAGDLLMLGLVEEAIELGATHLDYGATGEGVEGLYRFKRSHGGRHWDNSQVFCDLSGACLLVGDGLRRTLLSTDTVQTRNDVQREMASFLVGPPISDAADEPAPGAAWVAIAADAVETLQLPLLAGTPTELTRCALVGDRVGSSQLVDLNERLWSKEPPALVAAVETGDLGAPVLTSVHSLLRKGMSLRPELVRPRELSPERAGSAAEGTPIFLDVRSGEDAADLMAMLRVPEPAGSLRLPADRFGRVPVRLADACRLLPTACPARQLHTLHVAAGGGIRPCRPGPEVVRIGEEPAIAIAALDDLARRRAEERACRECPVATSCSRCLADDPLSGADYCEVRRGLPGLGQAALLVQAASHYVARGLAPAQDGFEWRAPAQVPSGAGTPDAEPVPALPALPPDLTSIWVDGRALACRVGAAAFAEVGETLAELLELARAATSPRALDAHLRAQWDADHDDVAAAFAALGELTKRLGRVI